MEGERYDVAVLGSGLAGSILATILQVRGLKVTMIERGQHPRMAIGESLVPASALLFWILGEKHGIPELRTLAHLDSVSRNVGPSSGVKRGFSYVYHREGQEKIRPEESALFIGPKQPLFRESQFYRADVDHYMVRAAESYGVAYRDRTTVTGIDISADGVRIAVDDGSTINARYVIDATGRNSMLAEQYGLREEPCRLRHHSRTVFTHMTGVEPLEDLEPGSEGKRVSNSWSKGTLHHVFDGGWFWVIPFNNYRLSKSDLVSVGLTVDPRKHPRIDGLSAEKEFQRFVERFPVVERHLGPAEAARPFVATERLQYSSTTSVGDRFLLLQHAYGFVDPLFSRGIWRSLEAVDVIADELVQAMGEDDLSAQRFSVVDDMQAAMLDDNDQMVFNAFRSMADYDTWTMWLRIWFADEFATTIPVLAASFKHATENDPTAFNRLAGARRPGTGFPFFDDLQQTIDDADAALDRVDDGTLTPAQARERICARLMNADYVPHNLLDFANPHGFGMDLTPPNLAKLIWWGRRHASDRVRNEMFDFSVRRFGKLQLMDAVAPGRIRRDELGNVLPQTSEVTV